MYGDLMKQKYHLKISTQLRNLSLGKVICLSQMFTDFLGVDGLKLLEKRGFESYKRTVRGYLKLIKGQNDVTG